MFFFFGISWGILIFCCRLDVLVVLCSGSNPLTSTTTRCPKWLVVEPPLRKISKSVGIITPNIWTNKKCSKPPTSQKKHPNKVPSWPHFPGWLFSLRSSPLGKRSAKSGWDDMDDINNKNVTWAQWILIWCLPPDIFMELCNRENHLALRVFLQQSMGVSPEGGSRFLSCRSLWFPLHKALPSWPGTESCHDTSQWSTWG